MITVCVLQQSVHGNVLYASFIIQTVTHITGAIHFIHDVGEIEREKERKASSVSFYCSQNTKTHLSSA